MQGYLSPFPKAILIGTEKQYQGLGKGPALLWNRPAATLRKFQKCLDLMSVCPVLKSYAWRDAIPENKEMCLNSDKKTFLNQL